VGYALLFDISERIVRIRYRRFGTTYRILLQVSKIQEAFDFFHLLTLENKIDVLSRSSVKNYNYMLRNQRRTRILIKMI
jgi:hypothetical protein